jgi:hypothetical protein
LTPFRSRTLITIVNISFVPRRFLAHSIVARKPSVLD